MARFVSTFVFAALLAVILCPAPTVAQSSGDLTAEEISNAFKKQKTRGLVIVPTDSSTSSGTEQTDQTAVVAAASAEYNEVAQEDQVNIQIKFDFDSAALREDQKPKLAALCEAMKSVDVSVFQIIGHTDSSGKASYNQRLSLLRAQEVKRHLVNECGIEDARLKALGVGESAPLNKSNPRADENRRVEFQALG